MVELDTTQTGGTPIEDCPVGNHHVQCFAVIDLGTQQSPYGPKHKIRVGFETNKTIKQGPEYMIGRPFGFYRTFNVSANERSVLMQFLDQWIPNIKTEMEKYKNPNGKLDLTKMLVKRYGTGSIQKETWNDGKEHIALKTVTPEMSDHPTWDLVNGPFGKDKDWRYPKSVREARANAMQPPEDHPNQYDQEREQSENTGAESSSVPTQNPADENAPPF